LRIFIPLGQDRSATQTPTPSIFYQHRLSPAVVHAWFNQYMQPGEDARPDIGDISLAKEANKYLQGLLFVDIMMCVGLSWGRDNGQQVMIIHTVLEESPMF
jgi:hypothetical protein